jgi:UDP-GlcNAc:undecaprenyl-phosphate/decaprenyl-phosphate GlcNAc-1-phosphate transferase
MLANVPEYFLYPAALIVSMLISIYAVRKIIFITDRRKIYDVPDNIRKIHGDRIPSLGGIGVFTGYIIASAFFMYLEWYYVVAASVILFFTGIYDDIMNMRPSKKLVAQLIASAVIVIFADIRIRSLFGIAGIYELPYIVSTGLTIFLCTFFINVFNFMDGIDGLACVLTILYTGVQAALFALLGDHNMTGIALSLMGATIGLLVFNIAPAKIYMGDTGSMMLGLTIFTFAVSFIDLYASGHTPTQVTLVHSSQAAMGIMFSLLLLPVFDALRVFTFRLLRGTSPLHADRSHVHYMLLDVGFSHTAAVAVIASLNVVVLLAGWLMQDLPLMVNLAGQVALLLLAAAWLSSRRKNVLARKTT